MMLTGVRFGREWSRGPGPQNKERDTNGQRETDKNKGIERPSIWNRSSILSLVCWENETQKGKPCSMENRMQKWLKFHWLRSVSLLFIIVSPELGWIFPPIFNPVSSYFLINPLLCEDKSKLNQGHPKGWEASVCTNHFKSVDIHKQNTWLNFVEFACMHTHRHKHTQKLTHT